MIANEILEILDDAKYNGLTLDMYIQIKYYINGLQEIAEDRLNAILKIENYCIEEKEDLISGGEVCEDILKIIDELKKGSDK